MISAKNGGHPCSVGMEEKAKILLMGTGITTLFLPLLVNYYSLDQWEFDHLHQLRI